MRPSYLRELWIAIFRLCFCLFRLFCSFKSYKSNATTSRMAREYWEMRSHASGCIANNALIGRNAFLSMQPSLRSCCIGNALLPIRALFAMQPSAFERISQYSLAILNVTQHYYSIVGSSLNNRWCVHFSMQIEELHVMT